MDAKNQHIMKVTAKELSSPFILFLTASQFNSVITLSQVII